MGLGQELLGLVLLLLLPTGRALGATSNETSRNAEHGVIGALALLVFWLWRALGIARMERDLLLKELCNETKLLRISHTSQMEWREEICRRLDHIYAALGKR